MKTITLLLFAFSFKLSVGQGREYKLIPVQPDRNIFLFNDLNIYESYKLDSLTFLFGWTQDTARGPRMLVKNQTEKIIFSTSGRRDSYYFKPTFFRSDDPKHPVIILAESGTDYSWGNTVFTLQNEQISNIGDIEVAAKSGDNPSNIAPFIRPVAEGETIEFNFLSDKIVLNPGSHKQMVLNGADISYLYKDKRLRLNIK